MEANKLHRPHALLNPARSVISTVVLITALLTTTFAIPALQHAELLGVRSGHNGWVAQVRNYLRNPIDYFALRSPGARGSGPLIQSKHRMFKLPRSGVKPHEQVLSNVRYGSPVSPYLNDLVPNSVGGLFIPPPFEPLVPSVPRSPLPLVFPPAVPIGQPNSAPGGTPGGASAVPETSTWLMLIWGMAMVGFGLRSPHRRRRNDTQPLGR